MKTRPSEREWNSSKKIQRFADAPNSLGEWEKNGTPCTLPRHPRRIQYNQNHREIQMKVVVQHSLSSIMFSHKIIKFDAPMWQKMFYLRYVIPFCLR
jgi:hypothetical protein